MDGRGRALDNIFVERLWRTVKYEYVYLQDIQTVQEAWLGLRISSISITMSVSISLWTIEHLLTCIWESERINDKKEKTRQFLQPASILI